MENQELRGKSGIPTQTKQDRLHYLDALRAMLMILGIVIHTANIFSPSHDWQISSPNTAPLFAYLSNFIHSFRMPAFFVISGFFLALTIRKKSKFSLRSRMAKLFVPFVFVAIVLNIAQYVIVQVYNQQTYSPSDILLRGAWVSHLWFLVNLMIYTILFVTAYQYVIRKPKALRVLSKIANVNVNYYLLLALFPLFTIATLALNKLGVPIYSKPFNIISMFSVIFYLQFLAFGFWLYFRDDILLRFSGFSKSDAFILLALMISIAQVNFDETGPVATAVSAFLRTLITIFTSSLAFTLFRVYFNNHNKAFRLISDSAYTIYLTHHILVIVLGILIIHYISNPYLAAAIVMIATFCITIAIHARVKKHPILLFLLNGQTKAA